MGRGRDKVILASDLPNMSPREQQGAVNLVRMGRAKVRGAAVVRDNKTGDVRYENKKLAGSYHEDKIK